MKEQLCCSSVDMMQRESARTSLLAPGLEVLRQTEVHAAV